jgi:hypothetical protein
MAKIRIQVFMEPADFKRLKDLTVNKHTKKDSQVVENACKELLDSIIYVG